MYGVRLLHFSKDWLKFIQIHHYYTMALNLKYNDQYTNFVFDYQSDTRILRYSGEKKCDLIVYFMKKSYHAVTLTLNS